MFLLVIKQYMFGGEEGGRFGVSWACTTFEYVSLHFDFFLSTLLFHPEAIRGRNLPKHLKSKSDIHLKGGSCLHSTAQRLPPYERSIKDRIDALLSNFSLVQDGNSLVPQCPASYSEQWHSVLIRCPAAPAEGYQSSTGVLYL